MKHWCLQNTKQICEDTQSEEIMLFTSTMPKCIPLDYLSSIFLELICNLARVASLSYLTHSRIVAMEKEENNWPLNCVEGVIISKKPSQANGKRQI